MFTTKESVQAIHKSTYISNWIFKSMLDICSTDQKNLSKYLTWIRKLLEVESQKGMTKNPKSHANYITRIINMTMGAIFIKRRLNRPTFFNYKQQVSMEALEKLVNSISQIFALAAKHKYFRTNLAEFTTRNHFDLYYRFLCELGYYKFDLAFCELGLGLVDLLEAYDYCLPNCYRRASVLMIHQFGREDRDFFVPVTLLKVNKYFFYDSAHKKLLTEVIEALLNKRHTELYDKMAEKRMLEVDKFLLTKMRQHDMLFLPKKAKAPLPALYIKKSSTIKKKSLVERRGVSGGNNNESSDLSSSGGETNKANSIVEKDLESVDQINPSARQITSQRFASNDGSKKVFQGNLQDASIELRSKKGNSEKEGKPIEKEVERARVDNDSFMPPPKDDQSVSSGSSEVSGSSGSQISGSSGTGTLSGSSNSQSRSGSLTGGRSGSRTNSVSSGSKTLSKSSQISKSSKRAKQPKLVKKEPKEATPNPSEDSSIDKIAKLRSKMGIIYEDTDFESSPPDLPFYKKKAKSASQPPQFIFNKLKANPNLLKKYKFYNFQNLDKLSSENFIFHKHAQGTCKFCQLFAGFYSMDHQKFKKFLVEKFSTSKEPPNDFTNHVGFAIVQHFFEVFLLQQGLEFLDITLNFICRTLVSKSVDIRVKTGFVLYIHHACELEPAMSKLLRATNFDLFLTDYMAEFMQNFKLLSFKQVMANKFEGDLEVEVVPRNQLIVEPLMGPVRRGAKRERTILNLKRHGDDEVESTVINFNKKVIYKDCIWDDLKKKFVYIKVILSPAIWKRIKDYQLDYAFDKGIYTFYFWRLHCLLHLLNLLFDMVSFAKGKNRRAMYKGLKAIPLQFIEMSILFKDYSQYFVPRKPFVVDSECWDKTKALSSEFNVSHSGFL